MPVFLNHVLHTGDSKGPTLLLIHPLGADLRFWDECIAIWKPHLACIACDLRAAGDSPRSSAPVSIAEHVADLETLRHGLGIHHVVSLGCAVGAMVAAAYAAQYPQHTAATVLANPALRTSPEAKAMLTERAAAVTRAGMAAILPGAVDKAFDSQPRDERYTRYLARFAAQDAEAYALSVLGILDADAAGDMAAIRCPTLVVAGAHDVLLPPAMARAVHDLVPQSQFVQFEEAAHFAPYQAPERFAVAVSEFLGRVLAESRARAEPKPEQPR